MRSKNKDDFSKQSALKIEVFKKLRKIRIIFDIENWLWKSEIVIFQLLDLDFLTKKSILWKSVIFHSIKLLNVV